MSGVESSTLIRDLRAESRALGQAWLGLQDEVEQLERHRTLMCHEWKDLEEERARLEKERTRFDSLVKQEWFPVAIDSPEAQGRIVRVNVGGQIFEISAKLLLKDKFSLLAATCLPEEESILRPDEDGCFFFDRDWFLFRHVLTFLQNGVLPKDIDTLRELYHEAGFYCLGSMQRDIQVLLADIDNEAPGKEDLAKLYKTQTRSKRASSRKHSRRKRTESHKDKAKQDTSKSLVAPVLPDPFGFTRRSRTLL